MARMGGTGNAAISLSAALARKLLGTSWTVDPESEAVRETPGAESWRHDPSRCHRSAGEARLAAGSGVWREVALPERVTLPAGTPLPVGGREGRGVSGVVWAVRFDSLMELGMRVERWTVGAVSFALAPVEERSSAAFRAVCADMDDVPARVFFGHCPDGRPFAERVRLAEGRGWRDAADVVCFLDARSAESYADMAAAKLVAAADWRSRS